MISVQFGAATAKSLFTPFGAPGVVFVRTGFAALILWLMARPQVRQYSRHQWSSAIVLGIVMTEQAIFPALVGKIACLCALY